MRILILGGTTEARELSRALADAGAEVLVSVASAYGAQEQGVYPGVQIRCGPMSEAKKQALLSSVSLCVDATHPYAQHVTASARQICEAMAIPYLRLLRPPSEPGTGQIVDSAAEAASFLEETEGNILLTTGVKELGAFAALSPARLFPRVLPCRESLAACEALDIPRRNIIAMQGPFSREMNAATIRQYHIRWLVTKDGGAPGGFPEKAEAARETGAGLLVIRRPADRGDDYAAVLNTCLALLSSEANNQIIKGETK